MASGTFEPSDSKTALPWFGAACGECGNCLWLGYCQGVSSQVAAAIDIVQDEGMEHPIGAMVAIDGNDGWLTEETRTLRPLLDVPFMSLGARHSTDANGHVSELSPYVNAPETYAVSIEGSNHVQYWDLALLGALPATLVDPIVPGHIVEDFAARIDPLWGPSWATWSTLICQRSTSWRSATTTCSRS